MAEYNYMIPVSSTGNATGPASANHLRVPVGPDGVGAFDHGIKNLKDLNVTERPIHCTDQKRLQTNLCASET